MTAELARRAAAYLAQPEDPRHLAALEELLLGVDPAALPVAEAWTGLGDHAWRGLDVDVDDDADAARWDLSLFVLAPNAVIPIHDHPGMTVLTRVLSGTLAVTTWDTPDASRAERLRLAPGDPPHRTLPARRNLHRLEAGPDGCLFLDLFVPAYAEGRRCSYYAASPATADGRQRLTRLG